MRINNLRRHISLVALILLSATATQLALAVDPEVALVLAILSALTVVVALPKGGRS
jgi:hypothetical protein